MTTNNIVATITAYGYRIDYDSSDGWTVYATHRYGQPVKVAWFISRSDLVSYFSGFEFSHIASDINGKTFKMMRSG